MLQVTGIGMLAIPIGIFLFVTNSRWLFRTTVFFVPFTATSVFELIGATSSIGIRLSMYLGFLWVARLLTNKLMRPMFHIKLLFVEKVLLAFVMVCYLSSLIPMLFTSGMTVYVLDTQSYAPLHFGFGNLLGLFYITFGVMFSLGVASYLKNVGFVRDAFRVYIYSVILVSLIGFVELASYYFEFNYPLYFLNNTKEYSQLSEVRRMHHELGFMRMASVADEPSILAQSLLMGIAVLLPGILRKDYLIGTFFDSTSLLFLLLALFLTGSTSGYIGLFVLIAGTVVIAVKIGAASFFKIVSYTISTLIGVFLILGYSEYSMQFINLLFLTKATSDSGEERISSIGHAWDSFLDSPFLGVGWASVTSFDLWVLLLSNVGLIGSAVFIIFVLALVYRLWCIIENEDIRAVTLNSISILLFLSYLTTASVAGWSFQFMASYLALGIVFASMKLSQYGSAELRHRGI